MDENTTAARHTCLKVDLVGDDPKTKDAIFVKGTWLASHFQLTITDGLHAWCCQASEVEVAKRAAQWDQSIEEYNEMVETYLGFQQPGSVYRFEDVENGGRRGIVTRGDILDEDHIDLPDMVSYLSNLLLKDLSLSISLAFIKLSFTFKKQGLTLEWRWKCQPSLSDKQDTVEILEFLMDANVRLSEEVVRKTQSCEKLQAEAQKCLDQSERFVREKAEFEQAAFSKFVCLLNSKKAKLRELRDRLSKLKNSGKQTEDEEGSTDKTESFDEGTENEEDVNDHPGTIHVASSSSKSQRRKLQK